MDFIFGKNFTLFLIASNPSGLGQLLQRNRGRSTFVEMLCLGAAGKADFPHE